MQTSVEDRIADFALGVPRYPLRPCTLNDIPWLLDRVAFHYRNQPVDLNKAETYWRATIGRRDHVYIRGSVSCGASRLVRSYWATDASPPSATDLFFFADKGAGGVFELLAIMRMMIAWARQSGCVNYRFAAQTGVDVAAMAKRLGAKPSHAMYTIALLNG